MYFMQIDLQTGRPYGAENRVRLQIDPLPEALELFNIRRLGVFCADGDALIGDQEHPPDVVG